MKDKNETAGSCKHAPTRGALALALSCALVPALSSAERARPGDVFDPPQPLTQLGGAGCPIETPDGLSLMAASGRNGTLDVFSTDRSDIDEAWSGPLVSLGEPVSSASANDFCPTPAGRTLYFVSNRDAATDGCGAEDIYVARQSPATGAWSEPVRLPCAPEGPNFPGGERSPAIIETDRVTWLFYSSTGDDGNEDLYYSMLGPEGTFGPGTRVGSLNTDGAERMPNVRAGRLGGYEIVFSSDRPTWGPRDTPAFGGQDVYRATASQLPDKWRRVRNLGEDINTAGDDQRATLSSDGHRLYYGSGGFVQLSERQFVPRRIR